MMNQNETIVDLRLLSNPQLHRHLPPPDSPLETNLSAVGSEFSGRKIIPTMDQAENMTVKVIVDFILLCLGESRKECRELWINESL